MRIDEGGGWDARRIAVTTYGYAVDGMPFWETRVEACSHMQVALLEVSNRTWNWYWHPRCSHAAASVVLWPD